jgi:hypothetical protein
MGVEDVPGALRSATKRSWSGPRQGRQLRTGPVTDRSFLRCRRGRGERRLTGTQVRGADGGHHPARPFAFPERWSKFLDNSYALPYRLELVIPMSIRRLEKQ